MLSKHTILVIFAFTLLSCGSGSQDKPARNVILFIGDGMGEEHRKAARWFTAGQGGLLAMDIMPFDGLLTTASSDNSVTDSAAAATAMSTGIKTNNGVVGLDSNLGFVKTILEDAQSAGKSVGLVTTTQITHATPAALASHVTNRSMMNEIALQMLVSGVDVLFGGGEDEFLTTSDTGCYSEAGERDDGRNLINEAVAIGYTYICNRTDFLGVDPNSVYKVLGLFADEGMVRPFSPSLSELTQKAIDILSKNKSGFFLMVEGGQIDWASHANDASNAILDTIGLDEAVRVGQNFAAANPLTLIIVTGDHETGGMSVSLTSSGLPDEDGPFTMPDGGEFYVSWTTLGHTSVDIMVTAQGPSSDSFLGVHANTFVHNVIAANLR
jgi:alkaline phosphatase